MSNQFKTGVNLFKVHLTDKELDGVTYTYTTPWDLYNVAVVHLLPVESVLRLPEMYKVSRSVMKMMRGEYGYLCSPPSPMPIAGIYAVVKKGSGMKIRYEVTRFATWHNIRFNLTGVFTWENEKYVIKLRDKKFDLFYKAGHYTQYIETFDTSKDAAFYAVNDQLKSLL